MACLRVFCLEYPAWRIVSFRIWREARYGSAQRVANSLYPLTRSNLEPTVYKFPGRTALLRPAIWERTT